MQEPTSFSELFTRYINNECSPEEINRLMDMLQQEAYQEESRQLIYQHLASSSHTEVSNPAVQNNLEIRLQNILQEKNARLIPFTRKYQLWWAAAAVIVAVAAFMLWPSSHTQPAAQELAIIPNIQKEAKEVKSYTRNITLPDGSTVVLKNGSTLDYPASFNGDTRQVVLSGEAYFDIVHDEKHPFIIHSGNIKTTVLGTAFNIRAYSGQKEITVAVTRGKVKVENQDKLLAVLTKDQQIVYSSENKISKEQVDAESLVTEWTKNDVEFEGQNFAEIADVLQKRFNIPIIFANSDLKRCTITASFNGTESLEKIVEVLCQVRSARYTVTENAIIIDGQGCR